MDLITQGLLGAVVGQVGFQKSLGRRALGWGAVIGMLPDLDVLVRFSSNPFAEMLYHRGITHSLWFGPFIGPLIGCLFWRMYRNRDHQDPLASWIGLSIWALLTHPLLDVFTTYGTQLLAPFSDYRFSLNAVPIIDPVYSGMLLISMLVGLLWPRKYIVGQCIASGVLLVTTAYLFWGLSQNNKAYDLAREQLQATSTQVQKLYTYPTILQLFLRRVVVETDTAYQVGFISTWKPGLINWQTLPKIKSPITLPLGLEMQIFKWFSDNQYTIEHKADTQQVLLRDYRFGLPGQNVWGFWGISYMVNQQGLQLNSIQPVIFPRETVTWQRVADIYQRAFPKK